MAPTLLPSGTRRRLGRPLCGDVGAATSRTRPRERDRVIDRLQGLLRTLLRGLRTRLAAFAASLLDAVAALTGLYYSKKYAAVVKRLGLRPKADETAAREGLIILQIDGLAHSHLQEALQRRRVPNLRKMLRERLCHYLPR